MWTIAIRELRSLFLSPLAWSILAVVQFIFGWIFAVLIYWYMQPDLQHQLANHPNAPGLTDVVIVNLFDWVAIVFLLVSPLLTMRLISEERRNKTLPLLLSAPVSMTGIILGKFLGLMGFFFFMLSLILLMPFSLMLGASLDYGQLLSGVLGILLLLGAFAAIGLYMSTLVDHPTVAAISTFGILLLLWIIDWAGEAGGQTGLLTYLSLTNHYQALLRGLFNSQDVIYYLLIISLFLILSIQKLDADRF